jgi:hypothetical protein
VSDVDDAVGVLREQLAVGSIQRAYVAIVGYMSRLRAQYAVERGGRMVSGLYQGCFDMTYFALFPEQLKMRDLKMAVVFDYDTFSFQAWLAGRNRKVQKSYWEQLSSAGYAGHTLVSPGVGIDAIVSCVLAEDFSLADESALTDVIKTGVDVFERDMLAALSTLPGA